MAGTVKVGCKLPHGLHLDLNGKRVTLAGRNATQLINGHGITTVEKDFFEAWMATNKHHPAVRNGHIFAYEKEADTVAAARERKHEKTGTEGLDPAKPSDKVEKLEK